MNPWKHWALLHFEKRLVVDPSFWVWMTHISRELRVWFVSNWLILVVWNPCFLLKCSTVNCLPPSHPPIISSHTNPLASFPASFIDKFPPCLLPATSNLGILPSKIPLCICLKRLVSASTIHLNKFSFLMLSIHKKLHNLNLCWPSAPFCLFFAVNHIVHIHIPLVLLLIFFIFLDFRWEILIPPFWFGGVLMISLRLSGLQTAQLEFAGAQSQLFTCHG